MCDLVYEYVDVCVDGGVYVYGWRCSIFVLYVNTVYNDKMHDDIMVYNNPTHTTIPSPYPPPQHNPGYMYQCQEQQMHYQLVFSTTLDALRFCITMQVVLLYEEWPQDALAVLGGTVVGLDNKVLFRGPRMAMALVLSDEYTYVCACESGGWGVVAWGVVGCTACTNRRYNTIHF